MAPSWFQILVVVLLVVLLFGRGKISDVMGDFAKGIKSFKKGLSEDEDEKVTERTPIEARPSDAVTTATTPRENVRAG
jgi:sec-independent protein translocase protein TatA